MELRWEEGHHEEFVTGLRVRVEHSQGTTESVIHLPEPRSTVAPGDSR